MTDLLCQIRDSGDVKALDARQLPDLASEIRQRIIQTISANGGHFGGPLGVVELAIALHYVFDFPRDRLIWDVGHQIYPHKLLTGRADRFDTLRLEGGLTGYPSPEESPYDLFTTAHAGVATSSAVGLAVGDKLAHRPSKVIAVVGDGAMSCGVAYEALNHAGTLRGRQLMIILNDNNLSIDRGVGALAELLDRIREAPVYDQLKRQTKAILQGVPLVGQSVTQAISSLKDGIRGAVSPHQIFEPLGFRYFGPHDGHDLAGLIELLGHLGEVQDQPVLLHLHTQKGRGFEVANHDPLGFHALTPFKIDGNKVEKHPSRALHPSYTETFGTALCKVAEAHPELVAITAAMPEGTGLVKFRQAFPDRYFDVAICEQHAVAFAAGLAKAGRKPVAAIYSSFLQRAFDQIFHEVSLQNLPVVFAMDRGGVVGSDGPTHHGMADIAYMRLWPNIVVCAPADGDELATCLAWAVASGRPVALRYPRDEAPPSLTGSPPEPFALGRSVQLRSGHDVALLGYGVMAGECLAAADALAQSGISAAVINPRFAKPLDHAMLAEVFSTFTLVVTVEDHGLAGGFGSAVAEFVADQAPDLADACAVRGRSSPARLVRLGAPDHFVPHATRRRQLEMLGLTGPQIADRVTAELQRLRPVVPAHAHHTTSNGHHHANGHRREAPESAVVIR